MPYRVRNISGGYKILLKHQVPPNGTLDLEEVFEGFCKPKRSKKAQEVKHAEWTADQFPDFLEKVKTEYAKDRGIWDFDFSEGPRPKKGAVAEKKAKAEQEETNGLAKKDKKKQDLVAARKKMRRAADGEMSPKELAWLKMSEETKKIIDNCSDGLVLKHAIKLARNIAGQERVRDLLERRLIEVSDRSGVM